MFKQAPSVDKQCHRSVGAAGGELKGLAAVVLCFIVPHVCMFKEESPAAQQARPVRNHTLQTPTRICDVVGGSLEEGPAFDKQICGPIRRWEWS